MNMEIVGLRFKPAGKILQYATNGLALYRGEKCVAESDNGLEMATVVLAPHAVDLHAEQHDLKPVLRKASLQDFEQAKRLSFILRRRTASTSVPWLDTSLELCGYALRCVRLVPVMRRKSLGDMASVGVRFAARHF